VAAGYGGVAGTDDVAPTQCPGRPGAASDGPAHAQPAPYRTNPVVVDDRVTGPTHSAPRIRPRTLNPLTSHELSRLPMRAPIIDSRKKWTNSWRPATRPPATWTPCRPNGSRLPMPRSTTPIPSGLRSMSARRRAVARCCRRHAQL